MSAPEFIKIERRALFPFDEGIYLLCDGERVVYVGQSTSITSRACTHISDRSKHFDSISAFACPGYFLNHVERRLIDYCRPALNGTLGKRPPRQRTISDATAFAAELMGDVEATIKWALGGGVSLWHAESRLYEIEARREALKLNRQAAA